ncbi:MAG TPA: DUF3299 domain-containing protein [Lacunisphaera sp.]|nr:DUF3299 domain-containing protein [Lacunisphaera sp.]
MRPNPNSFLQIGAKALFASLLLAGGAALRAEDAAVAVGFDKLASYEFVTPEDPAKAAAADKQIPDRIREFNDKKVAVTGFMLPVKMDGGLVTEFLLVKDPMMCCYGVMPKVNEWVVVRMVGKGVAPLMDVPITFEGKLSVGQLYEGGYLTGLYLLKGERRVESKS